MQAGCPQASTHMKQMTDSGSDVLRKKVRELYTRHAGGDLPARPFRRALTEYAQRLYNAVAREHLKSGESIIQEHHVVRAHTLLTESFLKDPNQEIISLYITDCRLIRLRSMLSPDRPITCDYGDQTRVDSIPLSRINDLRVHRQIRSGEIYVGLIMAGFAVLFGAWLEVTGPVLIGLGGLGILHGLLLPTRWVEIKTSGVLAADPMLIYASRRKSGRRLIYLLRNKICPISP